MHKNYKELSLILDVLDDRIDELEKWEAENDVEFQDEINEIKHQVELIRDSLWNTKI